MDSSGPPTLPEELIAQVFSHLETDVALDQEDPKDENLPLSTAALPVEHSTESFGPSTIARSISRHTATPTQSAIRPFLFEEAQKLARSGNDKLTPDACQAALNCLYASIELLDVEGTWLEDQLSTQLVQDGYAFERGETDAPFQNLRNLTVRKQPNADTFLPLDVRLVLTTFPRLQSFRGFNVACWPNAYRHKLKCDVERAELYNANFSLSALPQFFKACPKLTSLWTQFEEGCTADVFRETNRLGDALRSHGRSLKALALRMQGPLGATPQDARHETAYGMGPLRELEALTSLSVPLGMLTAGEPGTFRQIVEPLDHILPFSIKHLHISAAASWVACKLDVYTLQLLHNEQYRGLQTVSIESASRANLSRLMPPEPWAALRIVEKTVKFKRQA